MRVFGVLLLVLLLSTVARVNSKVKEEDFKVALDASLDSLEHSLTFDKD